MADSDAEVDMFGIGNVDSSESGSQEDAQMDVGAELSDDAILAELESDENKPFFQQLFNLVKDAYNNLMDELQCDTESCGSVSSGYDSGEAGLHTPIYSGDQTYQNASSPAASDVTTSPSTSALGKLPQQTQSPERAYYSPLTDVSQAQQQFSPGSEQRLVLPPITPTPVTPPANIQNASRMLDSRSASSKASGVSTGTTIISQFLTTELGTPAADLPSLFKTRDGVGRVVKLIAKRIYDSDTNIKVRKLLSPLSSPEGEIKVILGAAAASYASSARNQCYLCGGLLTGEKVNINGTPTRIDEVDHKVPCKTFYSQFRFVRTEFPDEYKYWSNYIKTESGTELLKRVYSTINNNTSLTERQLNNAFKLVESGFSKYLKGKITFPTDIMGRFNRIMRAYLLEFAYTHHVCNQVKSDYDLSDPGILAEYYKTLIGIVSPISKRSKGSRSFACLDQIKASLEFEQIRKGLTGGSKWPPTQTILDSPRHINRKRLVLLEMNTIMTYGTANAIDLNLSMKRSIIGVIKESLAQKMPILMGINKSSQKVQVFDADKFNQMLGMQGGRFQRAKNLCDDMANTLHDIGKSRDRTPGPSVVNQLNDRISTHWNNFKNMSKDISEFSDGLANVISNRLSISSDVIREICIRANNYFDKLKCIRTVMVDILAIPTYRLLLTKSVTDNIDDIMRGNEDRMTSIYNNINELCTDIPRDMVTTSARSPGSVGSLWSNEYGGGSRKCMTRKCRRTTRKRRPSKKPRRTMRLRQRRNNKRTQTRRK